MTLAFPGINAWANLPYLRETFCPTRALVFLQLDHSTPHLIWQSLTHHQRCRDGIALAPSLSNEHGQITSRAKTTTIRTASHFFDRVISRTTESIGAPSGTS